MTPGARTPEELETLLEDASIVGDPFVLRELFDEHAVLSLRDGQVGAQGVGAITALIETTWRSGSIYVADVAQVFQSRDTALTVGRGVNVMRRGGDGSWRYAICVPRFEADPEERNP